VEDSTAYSLLTNYIQTRAVKEGLDYLSDEDNFSQMYDQAMKDYSSGGGSNENIKSYVEYL